MHIATNPIMSETRPPKILSPPLVEVITLDTDEKVVQDDAHMCPNDDNLVMLGVDQLDLDLLQGLESPLQKPDSVLDLYTYLYA
jgi:hypothetical protein